MNKKGVMEQLFATVFVVILLIIILGVFYFLFLSTSAPIQNEILSKQLQIQDDRLFLTLMQSYVDDYQTQTVMDLLVESINQNDFQNFDSFMLPKLEKISPKDESIVKDYWTIVIYESNIEPLTLGAANPIHTLTKPDLDEIPIDSYNSAIQIPLVKSNKIYYITFWHGSMMVD